MFSAKRQEYRPTKNPFHYRGEYFDTETGNIYLRARYYVPNLGRFTQQDGFQYADFKNPTTLNLYAYCGNNPNNMKDSSGHFWETLLDIGSAVYSAVQFVKEPSWANAGYLLWDVGAAVIPVVPGSYSARAVRALANGAEAIADTSRVVDVADTATDAARVVDDVVDRGRTAENLSSAANNADFSLGNGSVGGTEPMNVTRTITKGEQVINLMDEVKQLTFETGQEHAIVTLSNGSRAIVSGGTTGISFLPGQVKNIFLHTHPYGLPASGPSAADYAALRALGQSSSYLLEHGNLTRFSRIK